MIIYETRKYEEYSEEMYQKEMYQEEMYQEDDYKFLYDYVLGEEKEFVIKRSNGLEIRFKGKLIGYAEEDEDIRKQFCLFMTDKNNYVCVKKITKFIYYCDDIIKVKAKFLHTFKEVVEYFGFSYLAQDLYKNSYIEAYEQA